MHHYVKFSLALGAVAFAGFLTMQSSSVHHFAEPIDALSVSLPTENTDLAVQPWLGDRWGQWVSLHMENEQDPTLRESNLVMFPKSVAVVRFRGMTRAYEVHPIVVDHAPAHYDVAAKFTPGMPKILSRVQWGADDSLLYDGRASNTESDDHDQPADADTNAGVANSRIEKCNEWQLNYPEDFRTGKPVTQENGKHLKWPRTYSPKVQLLVVHHTAISVAGDMRPAAERVRALYSYHAVNRGWGDIGYNYLVDETGQIYEGRSGGNNVVGGHVYCANVGTLGIALLGNFDEEQPTQAQLQGLKWLLNELADEYDVDLATSVSFHGMSLPAVVGHRDLLSTDCPGYYVYGALTQIRTQAANGDIAAAVRLPAPRPSSASSRRGGGTVSSKSRITSLQPAGATELTVRPGGTASLVLRFSPAKAIVRRERIAAVERSQKNIGIWQRFGNEDLRVRNDILAPDRLSAGGAASIFLRVQMPPDEGRYSVTVGGVVYTFDVQGRRQRTPTQAPVPMSSRATATSSARSMRTSSSRSSRALSTPRSTDVGPNIRIRLSYDQATAKIIANNRTVTLSAQSNDCVLTEGGIQKERGIVRISAGSSTFDVVSSSKPYHTYRGMLECRVIDGNIALINELPLEQYLMGLSEEPDTEPYEKQRAFAIAARTYAAYYLDPTHRKFPGMPYDGDDSPARFQAYAGAGYESKNPRWLTALTSTALQTLTVNGELIKPPYFSSDDGRTRSPAEAGWGNNYPFKEIFGSKPDPWCKGMPLAGHGVGMSGCGAEAQANEGKTAEQILEYYYPGTKIAVLR